MARILAYSSPATGHVYPMVPGLLALRERGHDVRVIGPHVDELREAGIAAEPLDPRIAAVPIRDYEAKEGRDRLHKGLHDLLARGPFERADLERAIVAYEPDVLREYAGAMMPRLNELREAAGLAPVADPIAHMFAPDRLLVLTGEPLEYPRTDTPAHVRFVGAQLWDPPVETPEWLLEDGDPWVLVTCSTEYQGDEALAAAAIEGLRDEPVRVIVTLADAHGVAELPRADNARIERFVPHGPVLERAAAVVCHGGMGIVQKAVAAGVPIVAVPFGRDQPEVGRRIAESKTGVQVKKKDLSAERIRSAVREVRSLRTVAVSPGGAAHFADAVEELVPVGLELEAHDRSLIREV